MNQSTKDRFDLASKTTAIVAGIVSAAVLILTMQGGNEQRASELRWNQAKLAMELVEGLHQDDQAFNALRMTDWNGYSFEIDGVKAQIFSNEVEDALNIENDNNLPAHGPFIRECYDKLFYHMGKIERSLKSDLVRFEDVHSPMDYYVPLLRSKYGKVLIPYMKQLHHSDALDFMNRFQPTS